VAKKTLREKSPAGSVQERPAHPDSANPVTWSQIDRAWEAYQAGDRGYSLKEMKARQSQRSGNR
jgi:hypothetical protein